MSLPKISSAMLIVTHACNLACRYCFVHQAPEKMSLDTAWAAARFLAENAEGNTPSINFFGGEPMLMWDSVIVPLTKRIRAELGPFDLAMTSNGVLLDDGRIGFMKENKIGLLLSIDGDKATQDYNRPFHSGEGSFDVIESKLRSISGAFPGITFRMTAIPDTCANLFRNILFAERRGFENFFVIPDNFQRWTPTAKKKLKTELEKYTDYYIHRWLMGGRPIVFSTFEEALKDIRRINAAEGRRTLPKCRAEGKCGLGSGRFASIHPDGSVYGCQEMTSNEGEESVFWIGNIFTGIREDRRRALMEAYCEAKVKGMDCRKCLYDGICDGGCVANNYLVTGDINTVPKIQCWWKQTVLGEAIRAMETLGEEKCEAFKAHWEGRT